MTDLDIPEQEKRGDAELRERVDCACRGHDGTFELKVDLRQLRRLLDEIEQLRGERDQLVQRIRAKLLADERMPPLDVIDYTNEAVQTLRAEVERLRREAHDLKDALGKVVDECSGVCAEFETAKAAELVTLRARVAELEGAIGCIRDMAAPHSRTPPTHPEFQGIHKIAARALGEGETE